jgi:hypothetical protein
MAPNAWVEVFKQNKYTIFKRERNGDGTTTPYRVADERITSFDELLKKYEGQLDWDYIVKSAHSWEIEVPVYRALRQARDLLGAPVPVSRVKALRPGVWHYWLIEILVGRETLVSPVRWGKLRGETSTLARSLMVRGLRRKLIVLSKYRGLNKKGAWLRTTFWAVVVFVAALWRYGARAITASF